MNATDLYTRYTSYLEAQTFHVINDHDEQASSQARRSGVVGLAKLGHMAIKFVHALGVLRPLIVSVLLCKQQRNLRVVGSVRFPKGFAAIPSGSFSAIYGLWAICLRQPFSQSILKFHHP